MLKKIWLLIAIVILAFGWHAYSENAPKKAKDVIKFSHKFHKEDVEAECVDCHANAESSGLAGDNLLPTKEECAACHDLEDDESCQTCHFDDEDTWQALSLVESKLTYSHEFHVLEQKMACETCHTNLATVDYSDEHSKASMQTCTTCHNNEQAPLECVACHTNPLELRPTDHSADFLVAHKNRARIDQSECATCHAEDDCAQCHEGAAFFTTISGANQDIQSPLSPAVGSGTRALIVSRVHELNFRLTHPLAAEGRSQECATCHDTRDFCQTCHEAEGVDVAGKPIWHGGPQWGALAGVVGSGGGRHAELAKRDIEACASCHSTQGDDPTCLLCHTDFDGVRNTNPRTHGSGFANQFGDGSAFHSDGSALCFSCHTDTQLSGVGFCGYCHEAQ